VFHNDAFHTLLEITSVLRLLTQVHNPDLIFLQEEKNVCIIKICLTSDLNLERQESEDRALG